jgi:murein DD-endopeptidase MepM/ murein hydrolase activator NlpD
MMKSTLSLLMVGILLGSCSQPSRNLAPVVFKGDKGERFEAMGSTSSKFGLQKPLPVWEEVDVSHALLPQAASFTTHQVRPGETVLTISNLYHIELPALIEINDLRPPYHLQGGQLIKIPQKEMRSPIIPDRVEMSESQTRFVPGMEATAPLGTGPMSQSGFLTPPSVASPPLSQGPLPLGNSSWGSEKMCPDSGIPTPGIISPIPPLSPKEMRESSVGPSILPSPVGPLEEIKKEETLSKSPPISPSEKIFSYPVTGEIIMGFGTQPNGSQNDGLNIAAPQGAPIRAAAAGTVTYAGNELPGFGNLVLVKHENGWMSAYGHMDKIRVKRGESLKKGQELGTIGKTGSVSSPQLHFELRHAGICVNPTGYMK